MTNKTTQKTVRYFRSFTGVKVPVTPIDEIREHEIEKLVSFYRAEYDEQNKLTQFEKFLNLSEEEPSERELVFIDCYEYNAAGELVARTLSNSDGNISHWFFDNPSDRTNELLLAHEQFTIVETQTHNFIKDSTLTGPELAVKFGTELLHQSENILTALIEDPQLRFLPLTIGETHQWISLAPHHTEGFDHAMLSKYLFIEFSEHFLERESSTSVSESELMEYISHNIQDGFKRFGVKSLSGVTIQTGISNQAPVAVLFLVSEIEWSNVQRQMIDSLLSRIVLAFERIIDYAMKNDNEPPKPQTIQSPKNRG